MKECGHSAKRDKNSSYCHSCYMHDWRKKNKVRVAEIAKKSYEKRKRNDPGGLRLAQKKQKLKWSYGLTIEGYNALMEKFNNQCAICSRTANLVIDHCHETNVIRGVLCNKCNTAIGMLGDNINGLSRAISYLEV